MNPSPASRLTGILAFAIAISTLVGPVSAQDETAETKPVVKTEADLPRFTYDLPTESASALLTDDEGFAHIASLVKTDVQGVLDGYVIEDKSTMRDLNATLQALAMLERDYGTALQLTRTIRELQEKPAEKLTSGLIMEAVIAAERSEGDSMAKRSTFRDTYQASVQGLPWDIVQDQVEQTKGSMEIISANLYTGIVQSQYDPAATETGKIGGDVAESLVGMRTTIDVVLPYRNEVIEVLGAYIDANRVEKPDIWAERNVDLSPSDDLAPVVVGIWDSGVDAGVYGETMFVNPDESLNGEDDDGNGFVDDLNGIAFGLWGSEPTPEMLYRISDSAKARLGEVKADVKGVLDLQAGIDSEEAQELKKKMAAMEPGQVKPFMEDLSRFSNYSHGTHVAGIAANGNPAAQILIVRETFPHEMIPPPIMLDDAKVWAQSMQRAVDYMKANDARVVNMSWGVSARDIENMLEVNGIGADAEERKKMAAEIFAELMGGMKKAMASAPGILFVPAAGNSDDDVGFTVDMPAAIDLPNVLSVGAVDQAGDETSFTSYGDVVRVHANGFEVDSYLPGGERMEFSGTSMAAPNVSNLAAKLIALDPSLTPEQVIELIIAGAETTEDGRRVLINPAQSVQRLREG